MKKIVVTVPKKIALCLLVLVDRCNLQGERGVLTSHGALSVPKLLAMLAEDAALVIDRPGSWEGSNMAQVLHSHGYEI